MVICHKIIQVVVVLYNPIPDEDGISSGFFIKCFDLNKHVRLSKQWCSPRVQALASIRVLVLAFPTYADPTSDVYAV